MAAQLALAPQVAAYPAQWAHTVVAARPFALTAQQGPTAVSVPLAAPYVNQAFTAVLLQAFAVLLAHGVQPKVAPVLLVSRAPTA